MRHDRTARPFDFFRFVLLLTGLAVSNTPALHAQVTAGDTDSEIIPLDPIVVIGTAENARLLTGSARVIDSQELKRFQYTNVHSVLRTVPGVYLREEDGLGTFPRIGIRASSSGRSDRIAIMEDGIPAAMSPYANTSAYYFPAVARMQGVEVLKGPEILRFGPQTTSGAINLISTAIPSTNSGFISVENGAWSSRRMHAWAGGNLGPIGFLLETYQTRSDGFQRIDRSSRTAGNDISDYMLKLRWTGGSETGVRQQLDLKLFSGDEYADVSYLGLTDEDFRANPDRRYGLSELERMNRGRESATLRYRVDVGSNLALIATGYYTDTERNYTRLNQINGIGIGATGVTWQINTGAANAELLREILHGTANTTHANGVRYGNNFQAYEARGAQLEAQKILATGALHHEILAGVRRHEDTARNTATISNVAYDQVNGSLVHKAETAGTPNEGYARATSLWLADRIRFDAITLLPLLRHERVKSRANLDVPTSASNELTQTTFGLGANYAAGEAWTFLAGVHQGFAPPGSSAVEGSRGEESTNIEGGFRYRGARVALDVVGFHTSYSNALRNCRVSNPCADGATDGVQQDGAKDVFGIETSLAAVHQVGGYSLPVEVTYTYTGGEYTRGADVSTGVREGDVLDHTPKHIGRATIGVATERGRNINIGFNFSAGVCVTTTCGREGVDARFLETEDLFTVDLSATYPLRSGVELYARLENLFDERRITHRGADGARGNAARFFGTGLRVNF